MTIDSSAMPVRARWRRTPSLTLQLALGFGVVIALTLVLGAVSIVSERQAVAAVDRLLVVDHRMADLSASSIQAMLKMRRAEQSLVARKDELGLAAAKALYVPQVQHYLAEVDRSMAQVRALTDDARVAAKSMQIQVWLRQYEKGFMALIDLYARLGHVDSGWEGEYRAKAHRIETLVGAAGEQVLMVDLLTLRRHEKDFIHRREPAYVVLFLDAVKMFRADLRTSGLAAPQRSQVGQLTSEYVQLFLRYAEVADAADLAKVDYVAVANEIEPVLEDLRQIAKQRSAATQEHVADTSRITGWAIVASAAAALLIGASVALLVGLRITQAVARLTAFARQVSGGDFGARVAPAEGKEFALLGDVMNRMAESIESKTQDIKFQATHDALTGLPNRNLLGDRLTQALQLGERYGLQVVVAFLDLDKFKFVNDSLGHEAGDALLVRIARRLQEGVRESDTVARLGGDEFVMVLYDQAGEDVVYRAMQRVIAAVSVPVDLDGHEVTTTCSIGVAVYPQDGDSAATLLKHADTAMYRAKEVGRNNFQFYTRALHLRLDERLTLEGGLRRALERGEFELHYQPRVNLADGTVSGLEALIRWNHPRLGTVAPVRFIPLAEELGLIHAIGDWVLRTACAQHVRWQRDGVGTFPVAVNVSTPQFLQHGFALTVAAALRDTGIAPGALELEITESLSMQDPETTVRVLHELKRIGVMLAIDDFGTGYSNLSYLKRFPVDKVKLDQSFVRDIVSNAEDMAISDAVIAMARSLRLKVTAEGVETAGQLALLAERGCDEMQGYFFSKPLALDACTALLREKRRLAPEQLGRERGRRTLLLVDDEPNIVAALHRALRHAGYHIVTAHCAAEAFALLALHEVGVILCDQLMPHMSGTEFLAKVRYMYPPTVRMILSGYSDITVVTEAINLGAVYKFLSKPWEPDVLRATLDDAFAVYERGVSAVSRVA